MTTEKKLLKNDLEKLIDMSTNILLPSFGLSGELTEEGIIESENKINEQYPFGHQPLSTTILPFGAQLGATIVKYVPTAKWEFEGVKNFFDLRISIMPSYCTEEKNAIKLKPFTRVMKYWVDDRADKLSTFYRMTHYFYKYDFTNPDVKNQFERLDDGWILFPNGDMIRILQMTDDQKKQIDF